MEYEDHTSPSIYVKFPLVTSPTVLSKTFPGISLPIDIKLISVVIWTTTPGAGEDGWQATDSALAVPPATVADALVTGAEDPVHIVRRSRVTHGQPVAAELLYVPQSSVPDLSAIDAPSGAARARAVLRELQRLELEGQESAVELGSARADEARELDRLTGAPVLVVTTRYLAHGRTAALSVATYRADTCRLTFGDTGGVEIHQDPERRAS